jgi:hypothetical protein
MLHRAATAEGEGVLGIISISDGYYLVQSDDIIIPDINNLTIQGMSYRTRKTGDLFEFYSFKSYL